jgi:tetratricopeptide (TPR) repeat protein
MHSISGKKDRIDGDEGILEDTKDDEQLILINAKVNGSPHLDKRKLIDSTTPTLEDEERHQQSNLHQLQTKDSKQQQPDCKQPSLRSIQTNYHLEQEKTIDDDDDVEEEMISLERERIRRYDSTLSLSDPQMGTGAETSVQRTNGLIVNHNASQSELWGFGLPLSASLSMARPPLDPSLGYNQRNDSSYTPASFSLTKNPHIQLNHGAFSPNTLRLTEDLDNLLDEEDEENTHQHLLNVPDDGESWSQQYNLEREDGILDVTKKKNKKTAAGRKHRGYLESSRESVDSTPTCHWTEAQYHQRMQHTYDTSANARDDEMQTPLKFEATFSPPSDRGIDFRRPVPSAFSQEHCLAMSLHSYSNVFPSQHLSFHHPSNFSPQSGPVHHDLFMSQQPSISPTMLHQSFINFHPNDQCGTTNLPYYQQDPRMIQSRLVAQGNFLPPEYPSYQVQALRHDSTSEAHNWAHVFPYQSHHNNAYNNFNPQIIPVDNCNVFQASEVPWIENSGYNHHLHPVANQIPTSSPMCPIQQPNNWHCPTPPNQSHSHRESPLVVQKPQSYGMEECERKKGYIAEGHVEEINATKRKDIRKRNDKKQLKLKASSSLISLKEKNPEKLQPSRIKKTPPMQSTATNNKKATTEMLVSGGSTRRGAKGRQKSTFTETNPEESKRQSELAESPEVRAIFKEFYRQLRLNERSSTSEAEAYALKALESGSIPEKTHWRIYLELADLAKRSNKLEEARNLFAKVCELQPYACQVWLEFSKLEEEWGHLARCSKILHEGLKYCQLNENLLTRSIKHEEKLSNLPKARALLARLKYVGIDRVWRTVLEGALMESRNGNYVISRSVLKYLMHHISWYGPLYLEAYRLERDLGRTEDALSIVERGLKAIPRYGPLWFGAFRLCETLDLKDRAYHLPRTAQMLERAGYSISRELVWKVHLEACQCMERAALASLSDTTNSQTVDKALVLCRKRVCMTALCCPPSLSWKVWLAGGRMELSAGNIHVARTLFNRAHNVVPEKGRIATLLECARLEEFDGDLDLARAILCKSRQALTSDWKIWLESVLLEIRDGKFLRAVNLAKQSLVKHSGTGRLWAALVQLSYFEGNEDLQLSKLATALQFVPKSGEVWCEGGRIRLNPFSKFFNLSEASRDLFFATRFTPQYGDGFLETLRLEIIERLVLPMASCVWEAILPLFDSQIENFNTWVSSLTIASVKLMSKAMRNSSNGEVHEECDIEISDKSLIPSLQSQLEIGKLDDLFQSSNLELRCANADPNYGSMWFCCRNAPTDSARDVLRQARDKISEDIKANVHLYVAAIIRYCAIMAAWKENLNKTGELSPRLRNEKFNEFTRNIPSLQDVLASNILDSSDHTIFLENSVSGIHFLSGLTTLNQQKPLQSMSVIERKKILFGSDALFS